MKTTLWKLTAIAVVTILALPSFAQDVIVTKDAKKIDAKILEVTKNEIKYKESDNLEGPTFVLEVADINSIIYSTGKVVLYNQSTEQETPQPQRKVQEEDPELKAWGEEIDRQERQKAAQRQEQERQARERAQQEAEERRQTAEMQEQLNQQLHESLENLGESIQRLRQAKNSYALDIYNNTRDPYRIILDGQTLGVVNPYKGYRFIVPITQYGRMQAVQVSGYMLYPTVKEYRIPPQAKQTAYTVRIKN